MNSDLLKYLQQDGIGKVIACGLADVYTNKPAAPVKYLAAWLKNYSKNQKVIQVLGKEQLAKVEKVKAFNKGLENQAAKSQKNLKKEQDHTIKIANFKKLISEHQYQEQLLKEWLPEFLEEEFKLTGSYIGQVDHPPKEFTVEDEEENAHLNTSVPKLINYIGSSKSHINLMLGKLLPLDKGVTAAALSLSLDDPQPAEDGTVQIKDKYVYIPNVVKNENVHYFRLPKLGSYFAVPLIYNSYLSENIFDVALKARVKYLGQLQEWEKSRAEELKEIQAQKQTLEHKLAEQTEKNDQAGIQATKAQIAQLVKRIEENHAQKFEEEHTQLPTEKRQFLVCGDTIGYDKEIPEQQRKLLVQLIKHFRDSWQQKERQLLYKDVKYHIRIEKNLEKKHEVIIEQLTKAAQIPPQLRTQYNEIEDEQLRQYKISEWQLNQLKKLLRDDAVYLATFFKLKNFRVVKFKEVIQTILFFLKYQKSYINLPGKNSLNWKKIRAKDIHAHTFFAIIDYVSQGPKTQNYPHYCKINYILQKLEKYQENELFQYSIGLGAAVHLIKKHLSHRLANIQLRRQKKENERKQRNLILQQNEKITEEKRQALEKHKQSLVGQDLESFKQEQWAALYDQENPLKEIPPEVVDDIDNDL